MLLKKLKVIWKSLKLMKIVKRLRCSDLIQAMSLTDLKDLLVHLIKLMNQRTENQHLRNYNMTKKKKI